ncbi:cytochrome d ubiquinol oxidase subunit II [Panacibacter ginsenosidivorans]|uniref:Cytochrome d ubiquinol oxidase subunit II n=1 Tax=Panacibacter ginsenosidivorans TaxID=1813871 RepID=A0A5B8VEH6_9BACT|nr:cytochrome d ubiquinol oxidase subunit II [Panacibacter ginsenosidivorans]QEC69884.1 cytochrome d ubiquinol oxidase subunit II [Panacibacter ginsenosidivorans]
METFLGIDYSTWWFLVVGATFTGYAILDGFDLGAGAIHLFFNKEESRRIALNAIGPVWDGNEVWLVIGGGTLFAGFPKVYAAVFSAFYIPFMLFLMALIFRAISIEFRSKEPMLWWRKMWDVSYCISSIVVTLSLGVVLGNVLIGLPIDKAGNYMGSTFDFLNPYALMVGVTTLALFMMHGAIYLVMKTEKRLYTKLTIIVKNSTIFFVISVLLLSFYTLLYVPHLSLRIKENPWLFFIPVTMVLAVANIARRITQQRYRQAFLSSAVVISLLLILIAVELYPNLVLSSLDEKYNLTVLNAASSTKSLKIMLIVAAIGVPLVGIYTGFVYKTFKGKVKLDEMSY